MKFGWQTLHGRMRTATKPILATSVDPEVTAALDAQTASARSHCAERMGTRAIAMLVGLAAQALAGPPPGVDLNSPTHAWFEDLRAPDTGILCCSEADCRRVQYRITGDHYEVFIDRKRFGDYAPDKWLPVPDKVVLHRHDNPMGEAVACYYAGEIHCFIEASGT